MADYDIEQLSDLVKSDIMAESQGVGELEVVTYLSGVNSLPALRGNEVVEVPLSLLSKPAVDAAARADAATSLAKTATDQAVEAKKGADTAAQKVTESILDLTEEKAKISEVYEAEQVRVVNEKARVEAEKSRSASFGILKTDMQVAIGGCEAVTKEADNATAQSLSAAVRADTAADNAFLASDRANTAADIANAAANRVDASILEVVTEKQAALDAADLANAAALDATAAVAACDRSTEECKDATEQSLVATSDCNDATRSSLAATRECVNETANANSAANNANVAATAANQSATNLSTIKAECQDATSRCNSTNATAEEKIVAMDAVLKSISAESQAAPVRLEVSVPESISTKNKVVQRIGFKLYPTYVMQNVLFQRVSGESVTSNPSGILSVKGTGTTKFYVIPPQNTEVWKEVDVTVRQPLIRLTSSGKMRLGNKVRIV